ncbi:MAG: DUF6525 family protein [Pseudomonadota bacterium]
MPKHAHRNRGESSLPIRRRSSDPMRVFDTLPAPLRQWLAGANMPWSPTSARRIWHRSRAQGLSTEETLDTLTQIEARTLAKDKHAACR